MINSEFNFNSNTEEVDNFTHVRLIRSKPGGLGRSIFDRSKIDAFDADRDVKFLLYYNTNSFETLRGDDTLKDTRFKPDKEGTRIIIGDHQQDQDSSIYTPLRNAYLKKKKFNVIVVDFTKASKKLYVECRSHVPTIGKAVGEFINGLVAETGISFGSIYIIGHGVGAHIAGYAGKNTKEKIDTIIGLNPLFLLFSIQQPDERLTSTDARYVEVIHTSELHGFFLPLGHADFYPNYGKTVPGCLDRMCTHIRAVEYFTESIERGGFDCFECKLEDISNRHCVYNDGDEIIGLGGEPSNTDELIRGEWYCATKMKPPYGVTKLT